MPTIQGHCEEELRARRPDQCFCNWTPDVECPNEYTHVFETVGQPGYMKCCEQHMEGFKRLVYADEVILRTRAEWEASGREAELDAAIAAESH